MGLGFLQKILDQDLELLTRLIKALLFMIYDSVVIQL